MMLRVWHNCPAGEVKNFYVGADSVEQAGKILRILMEYDLYQYGCHIRPYFQSVSGLEYFDEQKNEWKEWVDDNGRSIREHFRLMN